uniref:Uncharacterized protein n=1 Tax=Panagrolaimus superbus TaxID=310955 RepID=A0A914YY25_9BILA
MDSEEDHDALLQQAPSPGLPVFPTTSHVLTTPIPKSSEKETVEDVCSRTQKSLDGARKLLPQPIETELELSVLLPYPVYRNVDASYVQKFVEIIRAKIFSFKTSMFVVCQSHTDRQKYYILDGNHRYEGLISNLGANSTTKVYCKVYSPLSREQIFSLCFELTKPRMSLELRFLDQVQLLRKFMKAKRIQPASKIFDSQLELGNALITNPNKEALEVSQWPQESYEVAVSYIVAFHEGKTKDAQPFEILHHANKTLDRMLPDLKAKIFGRQLFKQ